MTGILALIMFMPKVFIETSVINDDGSSSEFPVQESVEAPPTNPPPYVEDTNETYNPKQLMQQYSKISVVDGQLFKEETKPKPPPVLLKQLSRISIVDGQHLMDKKLF